MAAIVTGNTLGLSTTSLAVTGLQNGNAFTGRSGESTYVNVATGNLVVQRQDDMLMTRGPDIGVLRTYNSQGKSDGDNNDNWRIGFYRQIKSLNGKLNTAGSSVVRVDADGAEQAYNWDVAANAYICRDGSGSYDSLKYANGIWTWIDGDSRVSETYDWTGVTGKLLSQTDPAVPFSISDGVSETGNTTNFFYDKAGLLNQVVSLSGESIFLDYSSTYLTAVRVMRSDGSMSTRTRYAYDTMGRLATVMVDLTPDDNTIIGQKPYVTSYTYHGSSNRLATLTQSDGTALAFAWDASDRIASITDALGNVTRYKYDDANRVTSVFNGLDQQSNYTYDAKGQLLQLTLINVSGSGAAMVGNSITQSFDYNANGDIAKVTDFDGRSMVMEYDSRGNQTRQRDSAGNTIERTYDSSNRLLSETRYQIPDPDGDGSAQPALPVTTRYVYDSGGLGLLRFVISAEGRVTEYRYNGYGQRVTQLEHAGAAYVGTTFTEASMSSWVASRALDRTRSQRTDYTYDFRGQPETRVTWGSVDASGQGVAGTANTMTWVYDAAGLLLRTIAPKGGAENTTTYAWDGMGRILAVTNGLNETTTTTYDDAATRTTVTAANGLCTISIHDRAGRLVSVQSASKTGVALGTTRYFYDAADRLRMTVDPTGIRNWLFHDSAGRQIGAIDGNGSLVETLYNNSGQVTRTIRYANIANTAALTVNSDDKSIAIALAVSLSAVRPATSIADQSTWNAYDDAGRLVKTVDASGSVTETRYDGASRVVRVIRYASQISTSGLGNTPLPSDIAPLPNAPEDRVTRNFYDNDDLLRATLDAEGYLTEIRYDAAGREVQRIRYATPTSANLRDTGTLGALLPSTSPSDISSRRFYNASGALIGELDGENYYTAIQYDANGNRNQIRRYTSPVTASVNSSSRVASLGLVDSADDQIERWTWELDRVRSWTDAFNVLTTYQYDSAGNLISTTRAAGSSEARTTSQEYDLQSRLTREVDGRNKSISYQYDAAGRLRNNTDANGNRTLFYSNANGQVVYAINAMGEVESNRWDKLGRLESVTRHGRRIDSAVLGNLGGGLVDSAVQNAVAAIIDSELDSTTAYTYSGTDRVVTMQDPLRNSIRYDYNSFGEKIRETTPISVETSLVEEFDYDRRGLLLRSTRDTTGIRTVSRMEYDAFGRVIVNTDALGNLTRTSYDRRGREVQIMDRLNQGRSTTYDAFDRVLTLTDTLNNVTRWRYTDANRSFTMTTPEGVIITTVNNRHGQIQSVTDGRGNQTTYEYDANGRLKGTTGPTGSTRQNFDDGGRLIETIDANNVRTVIDYDAANRVWIRTVDPGGLNLITRTTWDPKGQQTQVIDPNGVVTKTEYNLAGQVRQLTVDAGPGGMNLSTLISYDSRGKTLTVTDARGTVTRTVYDAAGRRVEEHVDDGKLDLVTRYQYDSNDNLVMKTDARNWQTRYVYDAEDRLRYQINALGEVEETLYNPAGQVLRTIRYANPILVYGMPAQASLSDIQARLAPSAVRDVVQSRVYDRDGRLAYMVDGTGAVTEYDYDANGNVVRETAYAKQLASPANLPADAIALAALITPNPALDQVTHSVYDAANRLVYQVDGTGAVVRFGYDANGNVIRKTAYANRLESPASAILPADVAGMDASVVANAVLDQVTQSIYDAAGRLVYQVDGAGAVTRFDYDANGNVVRKTVYARVLDSLALNNLASNTIQISDVLAADSALDQVTHSVYDAANRLVYQVDGTGAVVRFVYDANGNVIRKTAYANRLESPASAILPADVAGMDASVVANAVLDQVTQSIYDAAGRLVYQVDGAGAVTRFDYDANGNVVRKTAYANTLPSGNVLKLPSLQESTQPVGQVPLGLFRAGDKVTMTAYFQGDSRQVAAQIRIDAYLNSQLDNQAATYSSDMVYSTDTWQKLTVTVNVTRDCWLVACIVGDTGPNRPIGQSGYYDNVVVSSVRRGLVLEEKFDWEAWGRGTLQQLPSAALPADLTAMEALIAPDPARDQVTSYLYNAANRLVTTIDSTGSVRRLIYDAHGNAVQETNSATSVMRRVVVRARGDIYIESPMMELWLNGSKVAQTQVSTTSYSDYVFMLNWPTGSTVGLDVVFTNDWNFIGDRNLYVEKVTIDGVDYPATSAQYDRASVVLGAGSAFDGIDAIPGQALLDRNGALRFTVHTAALLSAGATGYTTNSDNDQVTRRVFDAANRLVYKVDAESAVTQIDYDAFGNVVRETAYANPLPGGKAMQLPTLQSGNPSVGEIPLGQFRAGDRVTMTAYFRGDSNQVAGRMQMDAYLNGQWSGYTASYSSALVYGTNNATWQKLTVTVDVTRDCWLLAYIIGDVDPNRPAGQSGYYDNVVVSSTLRGLVLDERFESTAWSRSGGRSGTLVQLPTSGLPADALAMRALLASDPARDQVTSYIYDQSGRKVVTVDSAGAATKYDYDAFGNVVRETAYANPLPGGKAMQLPTLQSGNPSVGEIPLGQFRTGDRVTMTAYFRGDSNQVAGRMQVDSYLNGQWSGYTASYSSALVYGTNDATWQKLTVTVDVTRDCWLLAYIIGDVDPNRPAGQSGYYDNVVVSSTLRGLVLDERFESTAWSRPGGRSGTLVQSSSVGLPADSVAMSNLLAAAPARDRVTQHEYDAANRRTRTLLPTVGVYASESQAQLIANGANGLANRAESQRSLIRRNVHDAFDKVVASVDTAGNWSYRAYDQSSNLRVEVDAEGYATRYGYDAFGNVTSLTRYVRKIDDVTRASWGEQAPTLATLDGLLAADAANRTIVTRYDVMGRVIEVIEPEVYASDGATERFARPTTRHSYDAFGQRVQTNRLRVDGTWLADYHYFDSAGREVAAVDAGGYLTQRRYDIFGNLVEVTEFAAPTAQASRSTYLQQQTSADDRKTWFAYDRVNRKTSETQVNARYSLNGDGNFTRGDLTTRYDYDSFGNQVRMRDAGGNATLTYYDIANRIRAVTTPTHAISGNAGFTGLTEFFRDTFGNVVRQIERANGASSASLGNYSTSDNIEDRTSAMVYDAWDRLVQTTDPSGSSQYSSYDAAGNLAKQWSLLTAAAGGQRTVFKRLEYDRTGQLTATVEPASSAGATSNVVRTQMRYNSFGELVARGVAGVENGYSEYFDRDNARRVWRSNSGDGVNKVMLYDLQGNLTSEIRVAVNLAQNRNASQSSTDRDASANRAVDGNINATANSPSVTQTSYEQSPWWQVDLSANETISSIELFTRTDWAPGRLSNFVVFVSETDLTGRSLSSIESDMSIWRYRFNDTAPAYVNIPASVRGRYVRVQLRGAGILSLAEVRVNAMLDPVSVSNRTGTRRIDNQYDELGRLERQRQAARLVGNSLIRPEISRSYDRWGNLTRSTDASGQASTMRYDEGNRLISVTGPAFYGYRNDGSYGDLTPESRIYYDYAGRQLATRDERGNINAQVWDSQGNLLSEIHADGGVVNYAYDAFGNRVQRTDAMGNLTGYEYDKLDRLKKTIRPAADYYTVEERVFNSADPVTGFYDWGQTGSYQVYWAGQYQYSSTPDNVLRWTSSLGLSAGYQAYVDSDDTEAGRVLMTSSGNIPGDGVTGIANNLRYLRIESRIRTNPVQRSGERSSSLLNTWDEKGNKLSSTNALNQQLRYRYDLRGNVVAVSDPANADTTYEYDYLDRKIREVDAIGGFTRWTYDYFGRLIGKEVDMDDPVSGNPITTVFRYVYDSLGQLISETNTLGQNIVRTYDQAGQLIRVTDVVSGATTRRTDYSYDINGRRVAESTSTASGASTTTSYDAQGRLSEVRVRDRLLQYRYDAAGNRIWQKESVGGASSNDFIESYFAYDAMNRQILVDGALNNNALDDNNLSQARGKRVTYDLNGNRTMEESRSVYGFIGSHRYAYDALGRLISDTVFRLTPLTLLSAGTTEYRYDMADRLVAQGIPDSSKTRVTAYTNTGRVAKQATILDSSYGYGTESLSVNDYDVLGNILGTNAYATGYTLETIYTYSRTLQGDRQTSITMTRRARNPNTFSRYSSGQVTTSGDTTLKYELNGALYQVRRDPYSWVTQASFEQNLFNDLNGQILVNQSTRMEYDANGDALLGLGFAAGQLNLIVNGQFLGTWGTSLPDSGNPQSVRDFISYQPVTAESMPAGQGGYQVRPGDTLRGIAQAVYGDAQLWFVIADANGINDGSLTPGQLLVLPNRVSGTHNNAMTFEPYNSSRILGDFTPVLPNSPGVQSPHCNSTGIIILAAVAAIAVSIATAGIGAAVLAVSGGAILGMSATASAIAVGVVAGAAGGALASMASQGIMVAGNLQSQMNWKDVGTEALSGLFSGAVSAGLGAFAKSAVVAARSAANASKAAKTVAVMMGASMKVYKAASGASRKATVFAAMSARGAFTGTLHAAAEAASQGTGMLLGLQDRFDWTRVAMSAAQVIGGDITYSRKPAVMADAETFAASQLGIDDLEYAYRKASKLYVPGSQARAAEKAMYALTGAIRTVAEGVGGFASGFVQGLASGSLSQAQALARGNQKDGFDANAMFNYALAMGIGGAVTGASIGVAKAALKYESNRIDTAKFQTLQILANTGGNIGGLLFAFAPGSDQFNEGLKITMSNAISGGVGMNRWTGRRAGAGYQAGSSRRMEAAFELVANRYGGRFQRGALPISKTVVAAESLVRNTPARAVAGMKNGYRNVTRSIDTANTMISERITDGIARMSHGVNKVREKAFGRSNQLAAPDVPATPRTQELSSNPESALENAPVIMRDQRVDADKPTAFQVELASAASRMDARIRNHVPTPFQTELASAARARWNW